MPGVQKADQDDQGLGVGPLRGGGGALDGHKTLLRGEAVHGRPAPTP